MANKRTTRRGWKPGPWDNEPDLEEWVDEATGLRCMAQRNPNDGFWCGYVVVAPNHPLYGHDSVWTAPEALHDAAHYGGVTWMAPSDRNSQWLIGFNCGHKFDDFPTRRRGYGAPYRNLPYVRRRLAALAAAVASITTKPDVDGEA